MVATSEFYFFFYLILLLRGANIKFFNTKRNEQPTANIFQPLLFISVPARCARTHYRCVPHVLTKPLWTLP